jgi:hypothetical protein
MDFTKISNYTIEIYFVLFYFGQRLYIHIFKVKTFESNTIPPIFRILLHLLLIHSFIILTTNLSMPIV